MPFSRTDDVFSEYLNIFNWKVNDKLHKWLARCLPNAQSSTCFCPHYKNAPCCFRQARLLGFCYVCKRKKEINILILPACCDASWRTLVKRQVLWCQEGCFGCVRNISKATINRSHRKVWGGNENALTTSSFLPLKVYRTTALISNSSGLYLLARSFTHWWRLHLEGCTICFTSLTFILFGPYTSIMLSVWLHF